MTQSTIDWLLSGDEPWTRYRTLRDLLDCPEDDPEVQAARAAMLAHPAVQGLIDRAAAWPGHALKAHNDADHTLHVLGVLADFGLRAEDPRLRPAIEAILAHPSPEGLFHTLLHVPAVFGGAPDPLWTWVLCDAPTLLYALLAMGLGDDVRVQRAANCLVSMADDNGWRCRAAPELGRFRGPGRKEDPCPIVNVLALKALALVPELSDGEAVHHGVEMLLGHWEQRAARRYYLFGIGGNFRKLKYPFVWYDILHAAEVLSRFPRFHDDPRYRELLAAITAQADMNGRYTAGSIYRAWKDWSFADKRHPSPWLTMLVRRIQKRSGVIDRM